jgi:hypothetical protein
VVHVVGAEGENQWDLPERNCGQDRFLNFAAAPKWIWLRRVANRVICCSNVSCSECQSTDQGRQTARVKRWLGLVLLLLVMAFVAHEQLASQEPSPTRGASK